MRKTEKILIGILVMIFIGVNTIVVRAQNIVNKQALMDNQRMVKLVTRLETQTDWFKDNLEMAFDNNQVNETDAEDEVLAYVKAFEMATDNVKDHVEDKELIAPDVEALLTRALMIEGMMSNFPASVAARADWIMVKQTLDQIAKANKVAWVWTVERNPYWKTAAVEPILDRLDSRSDEFLRSFKYALDNSRLNGTELEDQAIKLASVFEDNLDKLETRADRADSLTSGDMDPVLKQAALIEAFLRANNFSPRVWSDWAQVKTGLRELAMRTNVSWSWNVTPVVTSMK